MLRLFLATVFLIIGAATAPAQRFDDDALLQAASALTKVAAAVDTFVADNPTGARVSSEELLHSATRHDPNLLRPLQRFALLARAEGRNSSVLVCTADQRRGLIEDAGCTARSDLQFWHSTPNAPCVFSLNLPRICGP